MLPPVVLLVALLNTPPTLSVFLMARSAWGVRVRVSVEVLSAGVVSPAGWETVAVLLVVPVAEASGCSSVVTVKVTVPPGSSVTRSLMLPLPLPVATLEPAEASAVQVLLTQPARPVRSLSVTVWPTAVLGPLLLTTMVYTTVLFWTGTMWVEVLSSGVVSPLGCVTVAVLLLVPVDEAPGCSSAVTVKVTVPPGSSVTMSLMLPLPLPVTTLEPDEATAVQVSLTQPARDVRSLSVTVWSTAVLGPLLLTTMV